jgi:uncharacterized protein YjdB
MDITVHLNDKPLKAALVEFDGANGAGDVVPAVVAPSYSSSDPTIATVDAATGQLAYIKAGVTSITGTDSGNAMTASGTLTVTAGLAVSAQLQFIS